MFVKLFVFIFLVTINSVSAHDLTHQGIATDVGRTCDIYQGPFSLDESSITDWWKWYEGSDPRLVDVFALPENAVIENDATEISCSIYREPLGSSFQKTCGEVDDFLKAAQGAIEYCSSNFGAVPFFIGPESFVQATHEETLGNHHLEYEINQGIKFFCLASCYLDDDDYLDQ